jgi:hypothetical protein
MINAVRRDPDGDNHLVIEHYRDLRIGGVFRLPNGAEIVIGVGRASRYFLYDLNAWAETHWILCLPVAYEIDAEGWIVTTSGQPTSWRVEDLIDTKITVERT